MTEPTITTVTPANTVTAALWTPQVFIGFGIMLMVAGTIAGVFIKGDTATLQLVIGIIIGSYGKDVTGFYFGSSKSSQDKDMANVKLQDRSVVPTPAPAITTTTTTGATP